MTPEQLTAAMPQIRPERASMWAEMLTLAMDRFDIRGARRQAAFIAQLAHESAEFNHLQENLSYSTATRIAAVFGEKRFRDAGRDVSEFVVQPERLANFVYANRLGNGDEASGDGWRYRGRGPIQITGRKTYRMAGDGIGEDLEGNPDLVLDPKRGALVAGWYWHVNGCNDLADRWDFIGITQHINGPALAGLEDRQRYWNLAKAALPESSTLA